MYRFYLLNRSYRDLAIFVILGTFTSTLGAGSSVAITYQLEPVGKGFVEI